jgi:hypothetical protein
MPLFEIVPGYSEVANGARTAANAVAGPGYCDNPYTSGTPCSRKRLRSCPHSWSVGWSDGLGRRRCDAAAMTAQACAGVRELDSRLTGGVQVRLLWSPLDDRLWVAVRDRRTGEAFRIDVRAGERPQDVFVHPFAYASERRRALPGDGGSVASVTAGARAPRRRRW